MMKAPILRLGKHTLIYGFGNIASRLVTFLLLPFYMHYLTPADYGILQICNVFHTILLIIMQMGMTSSLFKVYYQEKDPYEQKVILSSTILVNFVSSVIILSTLYLLRSYIAPFAVGADNSELLFNLVLAAVFFEAMITLGMSILRAEEKSGFYAVFTVVRVVLYALLNIVFVGALRRGYVGAREAVLLGMMASCIVILPLIIRRFVFTFRFRYIKELVQLGVPLAFGGLAVWLLNFTDRYMIMYILPQEEAMTQVGIYSLGAKFAMLIKIFLVTPFTLSWGALMYSHQNDKDAGKLYAKVMNIFAFAGGIAFLLLSVFGGNLIRAMSSNSEYHQAAAVIPILSLSNALYGVFMVMTVGVTLARKTYFITIATALAAILNILLNLFLIPQLGTMGAVLASAISFSLMTCLFYVISQRVYFIPYETGKIVLYLLFIGIVTSTVIILDFILIVKFGIVILLLLTLPGFNLISYREIKSFYGTVARRIADRKS